MTSSLDAPHPSNTGSEPGPTILTPQTGVPAPLSVQHGLERLRQEQATFNQLQHQDHRWFQLRLAMGYTSVLLIPAILIVSIWTLGSSEFSLTIKTLAAGALFTDVLGLGVAVWKIVLNPGSMTRLTPITPDGRASSSGEPPN